MGEGGRDTPCRMELAAGMFADEDAMHTIALHCDFASIQKVICSCRSMVSFFATSTVWGARRMPLRNQNVAQHLAARVVHLTREEGDRQVAQGDTARPLTITCEGVAPAIGTTSLGNAFCGQRPESRGQIRKRTAYVQVDGELCELLVKEKKQSEGQHSFTPFSGAFYEGIATALIAIDLAGEDAQLVLAEHKVNFLKQHGAEAVPKLLVGLRSDMRSGCEHTPISYDKISAFCEQFGMVFVQTSAKQAICPGMGDISDLVAAEFNRADGATGEIAVRDVDGPFLLGTLMALDPDNTLDNLHTCCL